MLVSVFWESSQISPHTLKSTAHDKIELHVTIRTVLFILLFYGRWFILKTSIYLLMDLLFIFLVARQFSLSVKRQTSFLHLAQVDAWSYVFAGHSRES